MSKRETPMIRRYWERIGGTLIEEYLAVPASTTNGPRRLDAVILPAAPLEMSRERAMPLRGHDVIVVQAKASRLGMYLMGQALFSKALVERLGARSVRSVALCSKDDSVLRPLIESHGIEVVVFSSPTGDE